MKRTTKYIRHAHSINNVNKTDALKNAIIIRMPVMEIFF